MKSPDSRQILSSMCSLQLPDSWMKPIPHSVNLGSEELFKNRKYASAFFWSGKGYWSKRSRPFWMSIAGEVRKRVYHQRMSSLSTCRKWSSRVASGISHSNATAAIQMSFSGMGVPFTSSAWAIRATRVLQESGSKVRGKARRRYIQVDSEKDQL